MTFSSLQGAKYGLIMADPPWSFKTYSAKGHKKGAHAQYRCMNIDDIKILPVDLLAAPDCCLFLWATFPMLPQAFEVMMAWGFVFKSGGVWHKKTKGGKTAFGTGYRVRSAAEPFLLGFRGNPKNSRGHRNLIEGLAREHSRKPDAAYRWAETYLADARRLELFSRQERTGWDCWGDEADLFEPQI